MAEIATLGLKIENGQAVAAVKQTTTELDKLSASGDKATATVGKFSSSLSNSQRAVVQQAKAVQDAQQAMRGLGGASEVVAQASEHHALATGKAIRALEGLTVEATGANHQLATLGVVLGEFVGGHAAVLGALAAIGVGLKVFEVLGEDEKKAKEEQEKLTQSLSDWYDTLASGGDGAKQIDAMRDHIKDLREELEKLESHNPLTVAGQVGGDNKIAAWLRIILSGTPLGAVSQFGTELTKTVAGTTQAIDKGTKAITAKEKADALDADMLRLQIDRQNALNAAHGASQAQLEILNTQYDVREKKLQNAAKYNDAERASMDALADAWAVGKIRAAQLADSEADARSKAAELAALTPKLQEGFAALTPAIAGTNHALADYAQAHAYLREHTPEITKGLNDLAKANEDLTKRWLEEDAKRAAAALKYSKDIENIWRDGIGKIATNGLKSFQNFFDDVFQLFVGLMKRMQAEGDDTGLGYKLLGLGASAATGGSVGYASGSPVTGALSGAVTGASIAGPWGAVVGGLTGAATGLLGAAKAQREAADAQIVAHAQTYGSLIQFNASAGTSSARAASVIQVHNEAGDLVDAINKALPGLKNQAEREKELAQVRADEVLIIAKINAAAKEEIDQSNKSIEVRRLNALGLTAEANALARRAAEEKEVFDAEQAGWDDTRIAALRAVQALEDTAAALAAAAAAAERNTQSQNNSLLRILNATGNSAAAQALQNQIEIQQAIAAGLDEISIGLIKQAQAAEAAQREQQAQTAAINAQVSAAQDQLRTAQQQLDALRQIHDSLVAFGQSLKVGQFSTLSPVQQLEEARKQVTAAYNAALGGDQQAAQQFPSLAQAFLQSSRGYNASGAGYVMDFNSVQVMTDTLTESFGQQMTDQQKIVAALEEQIRLLQAQLTELQGIHKDTTDTADAITKRNFNPQDHVPEQPGTNPPQVPNPDPVGTPRGSPPPPNRGGGTAPPTGASTDDMIAIMADGFGQLIAAMQDTSMQTQANANEIRLGLQKIATTLARAS